MSEYRLSVFTLAAAGLAFASLAVLSGHDIRSALGAYSVVLGNVDVSSIPWWALLHAAELDLYLAVIPFAATLFVAARGLRRTATREERLFVAVSAPVIVGLLVVVAAFASTRFPGGQGYPENVSRLHERSTFVLAPLFFIGLAIVLRTARQRWTVLALVVIGAAVLPSLIPIDDFDRNVRFQALALVPWVELRDDVVWPAGVAVFGLALGTIFLLAMRIRAPTLFVIAPIVLVFAVVTTTAHRSMLWASEWTRNAAWGGEPNWVDAAVDEGDTVSVLWAEPPGKPFADLAPRHRIVFVGEFFNRSIGRVYELGTPLPYDLPTTAVELRDGRIVLEDGTPAPLGELVLVPCYVRVAGTPVARDPGTGAAVIRVDTPVRAVVGSPESCAAGAT